MQHRIVSENFADFLCGRRVVDSFSTDPRTSPWRIENPRTSPGFWSGCNLNGETSKCMNFPRFWWGFLGAATRVLELFTKSETLETRFQAWKFAPMDMSPLPRRTTPLKFNMEPKNHLVKKENHLPSTSISGFKIWIFQGVHLLQFNCKWSKMAKKIAARKRSLHLVATRGGFLNTCYS